MSTLKAISKTQSSTHNIWCFYLSRVWHFKVTGQSIHHTTLHEHSYYLSEKKDLDIKLWNHHCHVLQFSLGKDDIGLLCICSWKTKIFITIVFLLLLDTYLKKVYHCSSCPSGATATYLHFMKLLDTSQDQAWQLNFFCFYEYLIQIL